MAQQIGAALGLAVLTTISISAANGRLPGAAAVLQEGLAGNDAGVVATAGEALTHGYTTAFLAGAGMLLVAAVVVIAAVNTRRTQGAAVPGAGLDLQRRGGRALDRAPAGVSSLCGRWPWPVRRIGFQAPASHRHSDRRLWSAA